MLCIFFFLFAGRNVSECLCVCVYVCVIEVYLSRRWLYSHFLSAIVSLHYDEPIRAHMFSLLCCVQPRAKALAPAAAVALNDKIRNQIENSRCIVITSQLITIVIRRCKEQRCCEARTPDEWCGKSRTASLASFDGIEWIMVSVGSLPESVSLATAMHMHHSNFVQSIRYEICLNASIVPCHK